MIPFIGTVESIVELDKARAGWDIDIEADELEEAVSGQAISSFTNSQPADRGFSRPNGVVRITSTTVVAVETELFPAFGRRRIARVLGVLRAYKLSSAPACAAHRTAHPGHQQKHLQR